MAPREFDVHSRWKPEREAEAEAEAEEEEEEEEEEKGRGRESRKTEATCVASAFRDNLLTGYHFRTDHSKVARGTMYEPLAWKQTAAWRGQGGSRER